MLQLIFDDDSLTQDVKVGVSLKVADNEKKNVIFPKTPITGTLKKNHILTALSFQKIDPSKEGWGDITIEAWVKDGTERSASVGFTTPAVNVSDIMENQVSFSTNTDAFYNVGSYGQHVSSYGAEAADQYPESGYEAEYHRVENDEFARRIAGRHGGEVLEGDGDDSWEREDNGEYHEGDGWNENENDNFENYS